MLSTVNATRLPSHVKAEDSATAEHLEYLPIQDSDTLHATYHEHNDHATPRTMPEDNHQPLPRVAFKEDATNPTSFPQQPPPKNIPTRALVVTSPKAPFSMTPILLDEVRPNELLIEMQYTGICHTDIVLQQGLLPLVEFPAIFGHEGAGVIRYVGSEVKDKSLKEGDAVLLSFNTCGDCLACKGGHPAFCWEHPGVNHGAVRTSDGSTPARLRDEEEEEDGKGHEHGDRDGKRGKSVRSQYFGQSSFANHSVVSEKCVVRCPYPEDLAIYAPLGCGFQTGAGTILNVLRPKPEDAVVIFGLGSVGLAALMAAKYLEVHKIVVVDVVEEKLNLAKELGATHAVNSKVEGEGLVEKVKGLIKGTIHFAVDCTGLPVVISNMTDCVGPQGTAALVGVPPPGSKVEIDALSFLLENKKFMGVIEGDSDPQKFLPELMALHREGKFPVEKLCKTYQVGRLEEAIGDMKSGKVVKPVLAWQ